MRCIEFNKSIFKVVSAGITLALLVGCASTGASKSSGEYSVGPGSTASGDVNQKVKSEESVGLSVLLPIMDPNIPEDSDEYERKGIWPELRRAEANKFTVELRDSLDSTKAFESVRVSPDKSATGHLYVEGKIIESNGEEVRIAVSVTDITGKRLLKKTYRHRVKEYELENPRSAGDDLYTPVFNQAAEDVAKLARKIKSNRRETLIAIEEIRFAEAFSPEYFSNYIRTSKSGKTKLIASPSDDDPMLKRVRSLRIRDQMFIDNMQSDYERFGFQMDKDYLDWQKQAFVETKAAREARSAATAKILLGMLAVAGGAAMAANSSPYGNGVYGGAAVAAVGAAAIVSGVQSSKDAESHRKSLSELGRSLNIQLAPRVMELEGKTIELKGTASEQYKAWRAFLIGFYEKEQTPDVAL